MNNVNHSECDGDLLEQLVSNRLTGQQRQDVEAHIDQCDQCAQKISRVATVAWDWETVASNLTSDQFDLADQLDANSDSSMSQTSFLSEGEEADQHQHAVLAREISGWLDPTDDPHMMGRFAGYEIVGIIGHGGMGIVLKGFESSLNRYVAIKILAPRLATNGAARKRFAREAQAAAAVRHDNVIAVHRVDEWHGLPFLVMPYVAGISLQKRIDDEGPLVIEAVLRIGAQVAAGLVAAHAQGLVHRDIKPANVLLENGVERVTITDFGLARAVDDATITRTGMIAGTPQFMSPEQAQAKPLDHRSDLFSLGSVMYAMATGRSPFRSDDNREILQKIIDDKARGVREIQPSVPQWLSEIIDWLHEKSPSDRPQSAAEVSELLEAWLAHLQHPDTTPAPDRPVPRSMARKVKPPSRWKRGLLATAAAVFALLAGVIIFVETGKGTIRIESNVDDVPIVVTRDGKIVDKLTVTQEGASVRLAAGQYRIQIGEGIDGVIIDDGAIVLRRGEQVVANVSATDLDADLSNPDILIAMPAELIAAVKKLLDQMRHAHERNGKSIGKWGDQFARIAMCEGHRTMRMASLESANNREAFGFTTPMYDPNNRALVVEAAFRKQENDSWELVHLDVEPTDSAARDRESFRRNRPSAREHTVELAELQPEDVLQQARSANVEHAELTADELIGKWRVVSVTGGGRGAVSDELIGGFVEFGIHTMATFQNENSSKSLLEYKLEPDGKVRLQLIQEEKLSEFIFAGRVQRRQDSLHLALNISVPSVQYPDSAEPDDVEPGVKYFGLIREPQTKAERHQCEERDQMYLRIKKEEQPVSRADPTHRSEQAVREQEKAGDEDLLSRELIGEWWVSSVSGRTTVGADRIGERIEFEANAMMTTIFFPETLTDHQVFANYALSPNGEIRIDFLNPVDVRLGKIEIDGDSLFLALRDANEDGKYPSSAKSVGRESETDVLYLQYQRAEVKESSDRTRSAIEQPQSEQSETPVETITGSVVEVSESGLVKLSVGSDDGVTEGMWFVVLGGGGSVAHAKVKKVSQDHAIASIEWRFNNSFVTQNDRIFELRPSDRRSHTRASEDCFGSVTVTRTEAMINGVFRHPGKLVLQIGDASPELELRSELKLPVGRFMAEISYIIEQPDTHKERFGVVMRVAKSKADFQRGEYIAVKSPLHPMDLAQDPKFRFREDDTRFATYVGLNSSREPNKIVFADVFKKNGTKIPVSLIAVPNVETEQAEQDGPYREIKPLLRRFRSPHDPETIEAGRWAALVERVRTYRGHETIEIDALYADDSKAVGITTPMRHEDGHKIAVSIALEVRKGKWQITSTYVDTVDSAEKYLRKFRQNRSRSQLIELEQFDAEKEVAAAESIALDDAPPKLRQTLTSQDLGRLQGGWELIEYEDAVGEHAIEIDQKQHEVPYRITINGNTFTGPYFPLPLLGGSRETMIELEPGKSPKEMRLITNMDDGTKEIAHLLYRFQGEELNLSFVNDEAYRLLPAEYPADEPTGRIVKASFRRIAAHFTDGDSTLGHVLDGAAQKFVQFWAKVPQETRYIELQQSIFEEMRTEIPEAEVLHSSQGNNAAGAPMRILLFRVDDQYFCLHSVRDELQALYQIERVPGYGAGHEITKVRPDTSPLFLQVDGLNVILSGRTDVDAPKFPYQRVFEWGTTTVEHDFLASPPKDLVEQEADPKTTVLGALKGRISVDETNSTIGAQRTPNRMGTRVWRRESHSGD